MRPSWIGGCALAKSGQVLAICLLATPAVAEPWPSQVNAVYSVTFAGINIGSFHFSSAVSANSYNLNGKADLSALLGAFQWKGDTRSSGVVAGGGTPKPAAYDFDFKSGAKIGQIKVAFANDKVASVHAQPPHRPSPGTIPLKDQHLAGVYDPLSAIMALSANGGGRAGGPAACNRKLPIFDGKQRFDLVMSYKGQVSVSEQRPSGQPALAYVCRVKYIPVAGYKMNDETKAMSQATGIEVLLRPVPSANLLVPYQIIVPTGYGTATLTSQRIDIVTRNRGQIAFVH